MLQLASTSPRRAALLRQLGVDFRILEGISVNESPLPDERPDMYVTRLAEAKARAGSACAVETDWVLGADTCVVSSGDLLGKPADRQQAQEMLRQLSGRRHQVFTGVCLLRGERLLRQTGCTEVEFSTLTQAQQQAYLDTGEWQGKAGGYAIQGFASAFVCRLVGSYTNVVGLPLFETAQLLQQAGICVWQAAQGQHEGRQKKTDRNKP